MSAEELTRWWAWHAEIEAARTIPKAVEYGSNSMISLGQSMARAMGRVVDDEEAIELACFFYMQGKMGRWLDAIVAGRRPGDDTPFDIGVYAKMVQRNREAHGWPGDIVYAVGGIVPEAAAPVPVESAPEPPPSLAVRGTAADPRTFVYDDGETAALGMDGSCADSRCPKIHRPSNTDRCERYEDDVRPPVLADGGDEV